MSAHPPDLTPDCDACAALCCVALAFDKGDAFAIDKPAGAPCPHLSHHSCTIHAALPDKGFPGCVAYGCSGAGQRTIALFDGQSWQDTPALLAPQMDTFRHLRRLHDLIELLTLAAGLPLTQEAKIKRLSLIAALCPQDMTPTVAATLATGPLPGDVRAFLKSLAALTPKTPAT
ncbi:hypothetical protein N4R57_10475 [Rhodobacteraceae bacterium D3-12]|nr:hypothetical protein N4R57_10475 [Rhodobacteraceae bacterium D3-12]